MFNNSQYFLGLSIKSYQNIGLYNFFFILKEMADKTNNSRSKEYSLQILLRETTSLIPQLIKLTYL